MGSKSKIGWTNATWNFMRGCSKRVEIVIRNGVETKVLSEACRNCYAARVASNPRLSAPGKPYHGLVVIQGGRPEWTGKVLIAENHLYDPIKWKTPSRVFVNSMGDLFHPKMPWDTIDDFLYVAQKANWHVYQALTKYVDVMLAYYQSESRRRELMLRNRHIHWGISAENQEMFDARMRYFEQMPLETKWISAEPLLGVLNASRYLRHQFSFDPARPGRCEDCGGGKTDLIHTAQGVNGLQWIVVGGESGDRDKIRMSEHQWFRYLRDQASAAGIPFFMKQLSQLERYSGFDKIENFPEDLQIQAWPAGLAEPEEQEGLF